MAEVTRQEVDAAVAEGRLKEELVDIHEASRVLGIEESTLYQWRSTGKGVRSYKVGGQIRYDPFDLRAYLLASASDRAA